MNTPIEYNGHPVKLSARTRLPMFIEGDLLWPVPAGAMIVVCAWCKRDSEAALSIQASRHPVSHGICPQCAEKQRQLNKQLRAYDHGNLS